MDISLCGTSRKNMKPTTSALEKASKIVNLTPDFSDLTSKDRSLQTHRIRLTKTTTYKSAAIIALATPSPPRSLTLCHWTTSSIRLRFSFAEPLQLDGEINLTHFRIKT